MAEVTGRPAYQAVADDLRQQIESGTLAPGKALPSASALMKTYSVSSTVIKNAMHELRSSGYVIGQQGKGVYARLPVGPEWLVSLIRAGSDLAAIVEESALDGPNEPVKHWQQALDGVPADFRRTSDQAV
jgi:DNA-binding FadR family transcriptional regulator